MKLMLMIPIILANLITTNTFATVDDHDRLYLVVKHIESGEFFIERAPFIGCYGDPKDTKLQQFLSTYEVPTNIGCGNEKVVKANINYLTCAKVTSTKESSTFDRFTEITLDLSKCEDRENPQLITMIRTAAKLNFAPKKNQKLNMHFIKN